MRPELPKAPTGIAGLDEITGGGLPRGRPTLICGGAGSGKTLLSVEFLVRGATEFGEPGVFMSFEESAEELVQNVTSLGFDLGTLIAANKIALEQVRVERSEIEETGEYDLEGLFIRLGLAIDSIGARRVVLDTIESLFAALSNGAIVRAELRRLFRWLKDKGVTAVITGERGDVGMLTRQGLEEYVSDAVIVLDHRITDQISTRRLRVVKYRGARHGTNEYPFLIDENGFSVLPITSLGLTHEASTERITTGIARLDTMLDGRGYYRGSSVLVSGTAGTGKSSLAAAFVDGACRRGERCAYFLFEESPGQLIRNMRSIGIDLEPWTKKGLLQLHAARPSLSGLEQHIVRMTHLVRELQPNVVAIDPISNLLMVGDKPGVRSALIRLVDHFKTEQITALFTSLTHGKSENEETEVGISSLMDTWIVLTAIAIGGERNRGLQILKSRGMAHSNQIREFILSDRGIELLDVCVGAEGVLTGSARLAQEAREEASGQQRREERERRQRDLERRRRALEAQILALRLAFEADEEEQVRVIEEEKAREHRLSKTRDEMARSRGADQRPEERQER